MSFNRSFLPCFPIKPLLIRVDGQGTIQGATALEKAAVVLVKEENFVVLTMVELEKFLVVLLSSS